MKKIIFGILFFLMSVSYAYSSKTKTVHAKYIYHAPQTMTVEEAKRIAVDRAKIEAIAEAFGTTVSQSNSTVMTNKNGESDTQFYSLGGSEVNGERISDTKEPVLSITYNENMLVVEAEVWGKAREKNKADLDLSVIILCNGNESDKFRNKDRMSVKFRSPVNGFFSIWLADDNIQRVYCLLPYETSDGVPHKINKNKEYNLLSTADPDYPYKEETILIAENELEFNRLIFIFSSSNFSMPLTEQGEFVPECSTENFDKWLKKNRMKDENMNVIQKIVEIRK